MAMTVGELKELLEDLDDGVELRIMGQHDWPFEYSVYGVNLRSNFVRAEETGWEDCKQEQEDDGDDGDDEGEQEIVYILEGTQLCYGNKDAWCI